MFQENDYVMYGSVGVCRVQKVDCPDFAKKEKKQYYFLKPLYSVCDSIFVPVDNGAKMRKVLTKKEANELIEKMPEMEADWSKSDEEAYKQAIRSFDCYELAKLAKCLHYKIMERKKEGKKPLQADEKYINMAEEYLFGELSVALEIPMEKVGTYIAQKARQTEMEW